MTFDRLKSKHKNVNDESNKGSRSLALLFTGVIKAFGWHF